MSHRSFVVAPLIAIACLILSATAFSQPQKNNRALLKAKTTPAKASTFYYYLDEKIELNEADGLRAWRFDSPVAARAAVEAMNSSNTSTTRLSASVSNQAPSKPTGPAIAHRGNLASFSYLIVEADTNPAATQAAVFHKVKGDMPVYFAASSGQRRKPLIIPPQILVKWNESTSADQRASLEQSHGLTIIETQIGDVVRYAVLNSAAQPPQTLAAANALVESGAVEFAHPNFIYQIDKMERSPRGSAAKDVEAFLQYAQLSAAALETDDTYFPQQWHLNNRGFNTIDQMGVPGADISATRAWAHLQTERNNGIIVAVIDDGLDTLHEDMQGQMVPGQNFMVTPSDGDVTPDDPDSHGTATSGLVAAKGNNSIGVAGVAHRTDTKIMHVRIFDQFGATTDSNIGLAIRWAVDNGADVLSNSWGGGSPSSNITSAVTHALTNGRGGKGAPCLFATGNDYLPLSYPASLDNAIGIGGITDVDEHALYANFGPDIDVVAPTYDGDFFTPGIPPFERSGIWTIDHTGAKGYNTGNTTNGDAAGNYYKWFSGTSAATPIAAGVAALILQNQPDLTWQDVRFRLRHTADKAPTRSTYDDNGFSPFFGYGRVNALQAVNTVTPAPANYAIRHKVLFHDDFDSGNLGWLAVGSWAIANIGGRNVWTESPAGNYTNNMSASLISPVIDLSHSRGSTLEIVINHEIEVTPDIFGFATPWDFLYIEASTDEVTWTLLKLLTGDTRRGALSTREYVTQRYDLSAFDFMPSVVIRFRFESDESITYDGVALDRVRILTTAETKTNNFSVDDATGRAAWIRHGRELAYPNAGQILSRTTVSDRLGFTIRDGAGDAVKSLAAATARDDIFYILESAGLYSVHRIGWDGENAAPILTGIANERKDIAVNPAGSAICWAEGGNLLTANANGSGQTTLVDAATHSIVDPANPSYSPDGTRVYFDAETSPGNRDLYVINSTGANFLKLTDTAGINEMQPDPDRAEQRLAFAWQTAANPADTNISMITNLVDNRGGQPAIVAPLVTSHAAESAPRWSPRNDLLAFLREDGKIWVVSPLMLFSIHPELDEFYAFNGATPGEVLENWASGGAAPVFPLPNFTNSTDAIGVEAGEFGAFGFWLSPNHTVAEQTGDFMIARFNYSSAITACDVPQIRSRAVVDNQAMGVVMGLTSNGNCAAMPTTAPRPYFIPFQPVSGAVGQPIRLSFDMVNFDPLDSTTGFVYLHDAEVWQVQTAALTGANVEREYTFDAGQEGWSSGSAAPTLTAPVFAHAAGRLTMTATTSVDTFGFWQSMGDVTIEPERMYGIHFNMIKDARPEADNTVVRVRAFTDDGQSYIYQEIPFKGETGGETPAATANINVTLHFIPPYPAAGAKLHVAVDLLNFNPASPTDAFIQVDSVEIVSYDIPLQ